VKSMSSYLQDEIFTTLTDPFTWSPPAFFDWSQASTSLPTLRPMLKIEPSPTDPFRPAFATPATASCSKRFELSMDEAFNSSPVFVGGLPADLSSFFDPPKPSLPEVSFEPMDVEGEVLTHRHPLSDASSHGAAVSGLGSSCHCCKRRKPEEELFPCNRPVDEKNARS